MAILTDIVRKFWGFNFSIEVHENTANPDSYNITIEYYEQYWFFGFFSRIKVRKFMNKLECLINDKMSDLLVPLSDVHYTLHQEKNGIMTETYMGKLRFTLSKSPVSELADYFYEYHSVFVCTEERWYDSHGLSKSDCVHCNENRYYYFSSLYGVSVNESSTK